MKIDRVHLCAFRGISGELELALDSSVTLLYAPNGTGKSSICDAMEWLLTGRVGRMGHTLKTAGQDLRCRFGDSETFVEACIRKNGPVVKYLRRGLRESGSQLQCRLTPDESWTNYTDTEALEWSAPFAPRYARSGRIPAADARRWLRATHFFETPSLGFLIEESNEAKQTRNLLFANLLGVGEFESRDQLFGRLLRRLDPKLHRLEAEISELESAHQTHQKEVSAITDSLADLQERSKERLSIVQETLGSDLPDSPDSIPHLRVALNTSEADLQKKSDVIRHLKVRLPGWRALVDRIENCRQTIAELEAGYEDQHQQIIEAERILGDAVAAYRTHTSKLQTTEKLAMEVGTWREKLDTLCKRDEIRAFEAPTARIGLLQSEADRLGRDFEESQSRHEELRRCTVNLLKWQRLFGEERQLSEGIDKLRQALEPDETLGEMSEQLQRLEVARSEIRDEQDELSGALDRLRLLLGITSHEPWAVESRPAECPLCGHDHGTPEALRRALGATIDSAPEALQLLSRRLEAIQREIDSLHQRLDEQKVLRQRLDKSEVQQAKIAEEISAALGSLESALRTPGLVPDNLDGSRLGSHLGLLLAEQKENLENVRRERERAERTLEVGKALEHVRVGLAEVGQRLAGLADTALETVSGLIPVALRERLKELEALVETTRQKEASQRASMAAQVDRLTRERDGVRGKGEAAAERLEALKQELEKTLAERVDIEQSWKALGAPELPPNEADLARQEQALEDRKQEFELVRKALLEAEQFRREAERAENARRARDTLSYQLTEQRQKRSLLATWIEDLKEAREQLEVARAEYIRDQIKPLETVISAIYGRAQGNQVIDRINAGKQGDVADEPLGWRLRIGDQDLEISQLSLSQRQDLALAIFLARAHGLGGSFFLDEPLIHLDDLNRVALLDTIRVLALDPSPDLRLVITTASSALMSHFREKFSLVPWRGDVPPLRIYELDGHPRHGVNVREVRVPEDPSHAAWQLDGS